MSLNDELRWMRLALKLASKGVGLTSPNPAVGAIIVKKRKLIGTGWHQKAGFAHAEVNAIDSAIKSGKSVRGSTLYVTLEPCSTWGRTPPCVDSIVESGIKRVVVGTLDPNPAHQGKGIKLLKKRNILCKVGVLQNECSRLNEKWNYWITNRKPWVTAKCGMSLDGKISTVSGESKWITSPSSRNLANRLRGEYEAVLVGINTVLTDDPSLNIREGPLKNRKKVWKIILDSNARTPVKSKIFKDGKVWIFCTRKASSRKITQLQKVGANVTVSPENKYGIDLNFVLKTLSKHDITSLLVEGGGEVLSSFFVQKKVSDIYFFISPIVLGGVESKRAIAGIGFPNWKSSASLNDFRIKKVGSDLLVTGKLKV
jgi:diaminohydroxyphosphoribosylaminopyrimidine deaminase/5-amino-6-(5-phosphoribosylamino)uracil reductase